MLKKSIKMTSALYGMLPRLVTGKTDGIARMLSEIKDWDEKQINEHFDKIPQRYVELYNEPFNSFNGLYLFTELIKFLRDQQLIGRNSYYSKIITEAQQRVLQFHNSQFKNDSSSNTKLPS